MLRHFQEQEMNGYDDDKEAARIATIIARQLEEG